MIRCWTCVHGETTESQCADLREFIETVSVHCEDGHKMDDDCPHYKHRLGKEKQHEKK